MFFSKGFEAESFGGTDVTKLEKKGIFLIIARKQKRPYISRLYRRRNR